MADHEEAVQCGPIVLACTSLVFLCFVCTRKENKTTRSVGQRLGLSDKRETFGCYNSLLMSDLVNHTVCGSLNRTLAKNCSIQTTAIWSNYMRIDIDLFEELLTWLKHEFQKSLPSSGAYGCNCVVLRI